MKGIFFQIYDLTKIKTFKLQQSILMNDYQKSIDWPRRNKTVQGISYKWLTQILLSACIQLFLSFLWALLYKTRYPIIHATSAPSRTKFSVKKSNFFGGRCCNTKTGQFRVIIVVHLTPLPQDPILFTSITSADQPASRQPALEKASGLVQLI